MDLSVPWKITLDGRPVPSCGLVDVYDRYSIKPDPSNPSQLPWCAAAHSDWSDIWPKGRDAFAESVAKIWALKEQEEKGGEDESWKMHVEAWLVSDLLPRACRDRF